MTSFYLKQRIGTSGNSPILIGAIKEDFTFMSRTHYLGSFIKEDLMAEHRSPDPHMAELLCALSYATGLGYGGRMEHGVRTAYVGIRLAEALGLKDEDRESIFYGALLKDVGCTACAAGFAPFFFDDELAPKMDFMLVDPTRISDIIGWLSKNAPLDARLPARITKLLSFFAHCGPVIQEAMLGHCEVAEMFARRLGFARHVQETVRYQWERWDGKGPAYHLAGAEVPVASRILHLAQMVELTCSFGGIKAAEELAKQQSGKRFDPDVAGAFAALSANSDFCRDMDQDMITDEMMSFKPVMMKSNTVDKNPEDLVCEALADFIDIKCKLTWNHSREVAAAAEGIGRMMELNAESILLLRRAGLVHDIGKVGIPYGTLIKAKEGLPLNESESEMIRLHPYYTQRILERVRPFRALVEVASSHHEWINGQGYHRRLSGNHISLEGRILAVANAYANGLRQTDGKTDPEASIRSLQSEVGTHWDAICYEALCLWVRGEKPAAGRTPNRKNTESELSEREIEVLRLVAKGKKNPEIAAKLYISRKTVEHHLTHIYNKLEVSCRTSAVAYAMQNQIV
jgi:HD-GYP domain-containing protein (c-di-GMP phosphodiesterase class II)